MDFRSLSSPSFKLFISLRRLGCLISKNNNNHIIANIMRHNYQFSLFDDTEIAPIFTKEFDSKADESQEKLQAIL